MSNPLDKQLIDRWLLVQEADEYLAETARVIEAVESKVRELEARNEAWREKERLRVPKVLMCPRCRAIGHVSAEDDGRYRVDWWRSDGSYPDCFEKPEDWFDLGYTLADLKNPQTGCGYDG